MADKNPYPQIPSTVWWGLRSILQRSPNAVIDERVLGVSLDVQATAAKAYIGELKRVGLLSEDGKPTPLANKWRLDDSYSEAVEQILASVYPESLRNVAPASDSDRQKAVSWFMREGLGKGAAGNKAATYFLIGTARPMEAPARGLPAKKSEERDRPTDRPSSRKESGTRSTKAIQPQAKSDAVLDEGRPVGRLASTELPPLNINVQIHIGADADKAQIESIFIAMRKYLYDRSTD